MMKNIISSAYDMAILTAYAMENEQFKETVSQKSITVKYTSPENKTQICNNHNRLLSLYEGCIGVRRVSQKQRVELFQAVLRGTVSV